MSNRAGNDNNEAKRRSALDDAMEATAEAPEFRSVALQTAPRDQIVSPFQRSIPKPQRVGFDSYDTNAVIDKEAFFGGGKSNPNDRPAARAPTMTGEPIEKQTSNWTPVKCRPVPAFYPLEKSSRFVDDELADVAARLSECLRILSVQAVYDNDAATANLMTGENLEMHLSLWQTNGGDQPDGIVVELQRRKGCSITFHRYSRHILDAAIGDFDLPDFVRRNGTDVHRAYSRKVERLLASSHDKGTEHENAIIAIEIGHGLLMKDRMDARQLGLETLCLLTDPKKTGHGTAVIASRVVLLGTAQDNTNEDGEGDLVFDESPFQEIRETILSLVQLRRIGDEGEFSDDDVERDSDESDDDIGAAGSKHPEEQEHLTLLHNLALAVLANALHVMENFEAYDSEPEDTKMPANRARCDTSDSIAQTFMEEAKDFTSLDILSTLIQELGKAPNKPHNACLSAKCLRSLCSASDDARRKAKELGAKNVVNTALDVGERTHAKLELECKQVVLVLTREATEQQQQQTQEQSQQQTQEQSQQQTQQQNE